MATGGIPGARRVSAKEVRELLKLGWVAEEELVARDLDARVLPDGRVLLYWGEGEKGTLYPSGAAEEMKRRYDETKRKTIEQFRTGFRHPGLTLLPPVADFIRDVDAHAKSLGPRLRISDEVLDGSVASLDAIDKALKKIPWAKRQVPDLVTPLVAYVGEVMRKASDGRWTTITSAGHEDEPMVIGRDGRLCQPYAEVFLPMVEPSRRIPLRSAVGGALRAAPRVEPGSSPGAR
jgi:hypothetical protein